MQVRKKRDITRKMDPITRRADSFLVFIVCTNTRLSNEQYLFTI